MALQTAKERLLAKAAANKKEQDLLRASMPAADTGFMERLKEEEQQRRQTPEYIRNREKTKFGKALDSLALNMVGSIQMVGDTLKKSRENAENYANSELSQRADEALNNIKLAKALHGEGSEEHRQASEAYDRLRQEIMEYQAAPDKAVSKDAKGYQTIKKSRQLQEEVLEGTEGAGRFLGNTAFSIVDNLATVAASGGNPVVAATLLGVKGATNKAVDVTDEGKSASTAMVRGTVSGAIEAATEKMGLDNLADLVTKGGKNVVVNMLKQAGVEGTEEGFSYVFNLLADKAAKDPNAKFNWDELLQSIASGAISGLFFGAAGTAANRLGNNTETKTKNTEQKTALPDVEQAAESDVMLSQKPAQPAVVETKEQSVKELPVREVKTPERTLAEADTLPVTTKAPDVKPFTQQDYQEQYPNSPFAQKQQPQGLPQNRQESLQQAFSESVGASQNLGQVEKETGLPLPSDVQGQLAEIETLVKPMDEDADEVANTIRKYMGEEAANYWLEHKDENADGTENPDLYQRPTPENSGVATDEQGNVVGTQATEKLGIRIEGSIADMSQVQKARQAQWGLDVANKQIEQAEKELHASAAEKRMAENVAKGIDSLDSYKYGWDGKDNRRRSVVEELSALYRLRDTYDRNAIKAMGRHNKDVLIDTLNNEILNHVEAATPPGAASLHTNTWTRNNLRTWGRELGEKVNKMIFDPIKRNEANRIRWVDQQASDMAILGELTDAENEAVFDMLDSGKETAAYDGVRNEVVQEAANKLRQKYSQYYDAINDMLVAHGYPEIGFIKNYAPHKQPEQMKTAMSIFEKLGISDTVTELPTEIAGRTDTFKPGKKWNPHFLHRAGDQAAPDAVGGYLGYLNYMSEVMFHVDDIQRVRTFGDQIRYLYGDEGLQADYDAIRADTSLNEQEKELELARIRERQTDNSKMGGYVTALDNYANILAGKQTQVDRAVESAIGRKGLNWLQKPMQVLVKSSIPGNLSSAINQTVQLPWLAAEAGEANVLQAATELATRKLNREDFAGQSDFITGKRGAENFNKLQDKTTGEKVLDVASIPFQAVDDATSQIIVRAFYLKNVKAGMDHESAMRKADQQAESLVGSRMKGAKANVFSDKSLKALTTFQLEVANQWQHLKQDLPQEYRDLAKQKGDAAAKAEFTKRVVKGTVYAFALNQLIEQITGSKPVGFDIIGIIRDYILAGLPGEDEEDGKFDPLAGAKDLGSSLVEDLPFVGNIAAMAGIGDGRLPLPSMDWTNMGKGISKMYNAEDAEARKAGAEQLAAGVFKSASALLPMGNQIRKTAEGAETVLRGGRYTADNSQLMYEVEQTPQNAARGLLFGRNALPETREYWDQDKNPVLSEKQTKLMQQAKEYGVDQSTYVDFVTQAKKLKGDKDEEGNTIDGSLERKKMKLLEGMDLTGEQKLQMYLDNVASDSRKEDVDAMQAVGMTWEQMAPAIDTYLSMNAEDLGATQKATELAAWADRNLQPKQAAVVKERLDFWQMMKAEASTYEKLTAAGVDDQNAKKVYDLYQSLTPEKEGGSVTETQKRRAVAESDLPEDVKRRVVRSMMEGDDNGSVTKFDNCIKAGAKTADWVKVKDYYSNTAADKDKNGKSISGSKKEKVWGYINAMALSDAAKDALSVAVGYDTKLNEAPWNKDGASATLPGLSNTQPTFSLPDVQIKTPTLMLP